MNNSNKSFEEAAAQLEQLINEIENGSLPLEKMIDRITEGAKLIRFCQEKLNIMNGKVEMLFKDDGASGEFQEFDPATERSKAAGTAAVPHKNTATAPALGNTQDDLPF